MNAATSVLVLLVACNLFKYMDRLLIAPILPLIGREFNASDIELGAMASAFMLVYMFAAPLWGLAVRPGRRVGFLAAGIAIGGIATVGAGFARSLTALVISRSLLGIGQAGFTAVAPAFLAENYPAEKRSSILSFYEAAIPVGSAIGFILGGWVGHHWGWRAAFLGAGIGTLLFLPLFARLRDPLGGKSDVTESRSRPSDYLRLYRIPSYTAASFSQAAITFTIGGLGLWIPSYLFREYGLDTAQAGIVFGAVTVIGGLFGALTGGWLATRLRQTNPGADFLISGIGLLAAVPFGIGALFTPSQPLALVLFFIAEVCIFLHMGPLSSIIVATVPAAKRALGFAANIFVLRLFGDALSPILIGAGSEAWGLRSALTGALMPLLLGGVLCLWGSRRLGTDTANAAAHA
ncbi:MAG: MFS transporter [Elusimicrobia bacterium]|nr:MAG: MFS transporter [Elusimicrobiota bacterium]